MKKQITCIFAVVLICSMGVQALAFGGSPVPNGSPPQGWPPPEESVEAGAMAGAPRGDRHGLFQARDEFNGERPEAPNSQSGEMSDEYRAKIEAIMAEREEKLAAFVLSLSAEQKALFEAMAPQMVKPEEGQQPVKPDEAAMKAMSEACEALKSSLSEAQKAVFDELFEKQNRSFAMSGGQHREMSDEERAKMEAAIAEREEKLAAFVLSLTAEQKALFEAMAPQMVKPEEGQQPVKPDEAIMAAMKTNQEAFSASLSEAQKTIYDELFGKSLGKRFDKPQHRMPGGAQNQ